MHVFPEKHRIYKPTCDSLCSNKSPAKHIYSRTCMTRSIPEILIVLYSEVDVQHENRGNCGGQDVSC